MTFQVGDKVVIRTERTGLTDGGDGKYEMGKWNGVTATVTEVDHSNMLWLTPDGDRPDGFGSTPFYWLKDEAVVTEAWTPPPTEQQEVAAALLEWADVLLPPDKDPAKAADVTLERAALLHQAADLLDPS